MADRLAHLTLLLAQYLGLKLPHEIALRSADHLETRIRHSKTGQAHPFVTKTAAADPVSFATGLACLIADIQALCHAQGLELTPENEEDVGRLLYGLLAAPELARHSDNLAYPNAHMNNNKEKGTKREAAGGATIDRSISRLADRIAEDLMTDPFEFIEHQQSQSVAFTEADDH